MEAFRRRPASVRFTVMNGISTAFLAGLVALGATGCAGATGSGAVLAPSAPSAATVPATEQAAIASGEIVAKPLQFERGSSKYVGGIASGLVPATPERVLRAFSDPSALAHMLPRTKQVTFLGRTADGDHIELLQGNSWLSAKYTVALEASAVPGELRFWLDRSRHHDIDDVYGYFRVQRFDEHRSLVTVAAAVDVGSDFTNMIVGRRVQDAILSTPRLMRDYFARTEPRDDDPRVAVNDLR